MGRRCRLGRRHAPHDVLASERRHDHGPEPHLRRRSRDANGHSQVTDTGGPDPPVRRHSPSPSATSRRRSADSGAAHVNEGSPYSLTLGSVTDPGTDTVSSYIVHWGDGNTDTYATDGAKTHTYDEGRDARPITVDLVDEDGTFLAAGTTSVIVDNVAPTTTFLSGDTTVDEFDVTVHTYVFSIFDPGADTIIGTGTSCGVGGTPDGSVTSTNTSVTFSCKFLNGPANPQLQANATDSDVGTGPFTFQTVHVNNVAPVATNDTGTTERGIRTSSPPPRASSGTTAMSPPIYCRSRRSTAPL